MNKEIFTKKIEHAIKSPTGQKVIRVLGAGTVVGVALGATACYPDKVIIHDGATTGTSTPSAASGETTTIINNYNYNTTIDQPTKTEAPKAKPTPTIEFEMNFGGTRTVNIPRFVSDSTVDTAKGQFVNKIDQGSEAFAAEPGGLLVGPDFGSMSSENPNGNNPAGWNAMYRSEGSIQPFSSVTQEVIRWPNEAYQNVPEGGFMMGTWGQAKVTIDNVSIDMPAKPNNTYIFIARGANGDNLQNTDKNKTAKITKYVPGHAEVKMYQARQKTNTAFISEGQFAQIVRDAHSGGTNNGDGGSSKVTVVYYDVNSKAYLVIEQEAGRLENIDAYYRNWKKVFSNFTVRGPQGGNISSEINSATETNAFDFDVYTPSDTAREHGDFSKVRYNHETKHYDLIDMRTNEKIDISKYLGKTAALTTGVGQTTRLPFTLEPGQAAVITAWQIEGVNGTGIYRVVENNSDKAKFYDFGRMSDAEVEIVPVVNASAHLAKDLNEAVEKGWDHSSIGSSTN